MQRNGLSKKEAAIREGRHFKFVESKKHTLGQLIDRYIRDVLPTKYIDEIVKITKLDPERTIKSLNDKEFDLFWRAIEQIEKWTVGEEDFIEKGIISGVHKKRGVIFDYLVQKSHESHWVDKRRSNHFSNSHYPCCVM